jgi:hypothetical protein
MTSLLANNRDATTAVAARSAFDSAPATGTTATTPTAMTATSTGTTSSTLNSKIFKAQAKWVQNRMGRHLPRL